MGKTMSNLTVWLIRHGQSTANARQASKTVTLTELGKKQAHIAAQNIIQPPDLIVTSPLPRAIESAQPICKIWPDARCEQWPIQEFTYLSSKHFYSMTPDERIQVIKTYWENGEPY